MKNILVHGLGQNPHSWDQVSIFLEKEGTEILCPDLFHLADISPMEYRGLYQSFSEFCHSQKEELNLCGLSLGGILAADFAKEYPEKVRSLILIGTPYQIPRILFRVQNFVFHLMPKSVFQNMGVSKTDFIALVHSMGKLDIAENMDRISCKTLILCGEKDTANRKSAKLLHQNIKNSRIGIVPHSAHEVNCDNPEILAKLIGGFWREETGCEKRSFGRRGNSATSN